jgi:hypothetical protein
MTSLEIDGLLALSGLLCFVVSFILVDGARDDGLTGDTLTPKNRRSLGNTGCGVFLLGIGLLGAAFIRFVAYVG